MQVVSEARERERPSRPSISQPRFPPEIYEELRTVARSEGLGIATWIRRTCLKALEVHKQQKASRD